MTGFETGMYENERIHPNNSRVKMDLRLGKIIKQVPVSGRLPGKDNAGPIDEAC